MDVVADAFVKLVTKGGIYLLNYSTEAGFLDEIPKSVLFTVTSTALPQDFYFFRLTQPLTYFYSSVTVHYKGERRKA